MLIAGCGGGGTGGENGDDPVADDATEQADGDHEGPSPLAEFVGAGAGIAMGRAGAWSFLEQSGSEVDQEERQRTRQVEDLVAVCMQEAGFEYIPADPLGGEAGGASFDEAYALPPEEFVRQYGYGKSTLALGRTGEAVLDPNADIRENLSAAALEEYNSTLWGDPADTGGPLEEQGCYGQARVDVYGEGGGRPDLTEFEGLFQDIEALRRRVANDPRLVEATEEWAACMAEAGYGEFETTTGPEESVAAQLGTLIEGGDEIDPDALAELQEYEVVVATADYECEQAHYVDVQNDVAWDLEQDFVDQQRELLERYREVVLEDGGGSAADG